MLGAMVTAVLSLLGLVSTAVTPSFVPIASNGVSSPSSLSGNLTANPAFPDARFSVSPAFGPSFLPPNPTLMNIMYFMAEIAYDDFNGSVDSNVWTGASYTEVQIVTGHPIKAKYLLFGAFSAIEYMIKFNRFQEGQWVLKWENNEVGRLWILAEAPELQQLGTDDGTNSSWKDGIPPTAQTAVADKIQGLRLVSNTTSLSADVDVEIIYFPRGSLLDRYEVFLCLYSAVIHLAQLEPHVRVVDIQAANPIKSVELSAITRSPGARIFETLQGLADVPKKMLESRSGFREVAFYLVQGEVRVMEGMIRQISL